MTLDQIQSLTDEEIRVRVAELCGWKRRAWQDRKGRPCKAWTSPEGRDMAGMPPNYPADLNACHEFERMLIGPQAVSYGTRLAQLQRRDITIEPGDRYPKAATVHEWHATARQRCEAFLAVMGGKPL